MQDKTDDLNRQAWEVRVSDSNKALLLSQEALALATSAGYTRGRAEALRTLGFTLIRHSKHEDALKHIEEALHLFEEMGDESGQSDVYEYFGIIQRSLGNYGASIEFLNTSLTLRKKNNYRAGESLSYYHLGVTYKYLGDLEQALEYFQQSLAISREINDWISESYSLNNIGGIYFELSDYDNALQFFQESLAIRKKAGDKWGEAGCLDNIGHIFLKKGDYNAALEYCQQSLLICNNVADKKGEANSLFHLAEANEKIPDLVAALKCASQSLQIREEIGDKKGQAELCLLLAEMHGKDVPAKTAPDVQLDYLKRAQALAKETNALDLLYKVHRGFYHLYKERKDYHEALSELERSYLAEQEIHSRNVQQKILTLQVSHKVEQAKKEAEIYRLRNIELASLYDESTRQKEEIEAQRNTLEQALNELKTTQTQLIQSEKMASLGELTAGIAHEIQNPLNFVNNFAEVNAELIDELKLELGEGNYPEVIIISENIKENQLKISHHGKRADSIVKGMLMHSRRSTGEKEPTDINVLADEYLRLSYHGLRAKDKTFNADMHTNFDDTIGKINIIAQDIGRVLLNLFTNAFYSVAEKKKQVPEGFEPLVSVRTRAIGNTVEISVKDNGTGIPQEVLDKIYQPFFSTKPTGQGTGLGLSLSYDTIKAHGGEIKVETKEGEFAEFIILLRYN
jgi:two-component system, NtrC family, sensor kinase